MRRRAHGEDEEGGSREQGGDGEDGEGDQARGAEQGESGLWSLDSIVKLGGEVSNKPGDEPSGEVSDESSDETNDAKRLRGDADANADADADADADSNDARPVVKRAKTKSSTLTSGWKAPRPAIKAVPTEQKEQESPRQSPRKVPTTNGDEQKKEDTEVVSTNDSGDEQQQPGFLHVLAVEEHLKGKSGRPVSRATWLASDESMRDKAACFLINGYLMVSNVERGKCIMGWKALGECPQSCE